MCLGLDVHVNMYVCARGSSLDTIISKFPSLITVYYKFLLATVCVCMYVNGCMCSVCITYHVYIYHMYECVGLVSVSH